MRIKQNIGLVVGIIGVLLIIFGELLLFARIGYFTGEDFYKYYAGELGKLSFSRIYTGGGIGIVGVLLILIGVFSVFRRKEQFLSLGVLALLIINVGVYHASLIPFAVSIKQDVYEDYEAGFQLMSILWISLGWLKLATVFIVFIQKLTEKIDLSWLTIAVLLLLPFDDVCKNLPAYGGFISATYSNLVLLAFFILCFREKGVLNEKTLI